MPSLNPSQKIIAAITLLFIAGASYLFFVDSHYSSRPANWFSLSFVEPKSDKLNFVIENFGPDADFHWEVLAEKESIADGYSTVVSGSKKEIGGNVTDEKSERITIRVSSQGQTLELYKNIK
jgi:hypothetical protein